MVKKPIVVMVFASEGSPDSTRYGGFARRLQKRCGLEGFEVVTVALENLVYIVNEKHEASVVDSVSGIDLVNASFVYLKSWQSMPDEAAALAICLFHKGVQFADLLAMHKGTSKLSTIFKLWAAEVSVPATIYARKPDVLVRYITDNVDLVGEKFILKDVNGAKGKLNFYCDIKEAEKILDQHDDVCFMVQRFIANDGDWRVGIYMERTGFVIKRIGSGDTHLNNTSTGGKAEYYSTKDAPHNVRHLARRAAAAAELQVAGVDVIVDKHTKKPYILEVNQGSQIVTGAFVNKNIKGFNRNFSRVLRGESYKRVRKQPMKTVGRRVVVKLPEFGIKRIISKVDTGAYNSSLHVDNVRVNGDELLFDVVPTDKLETIDGKVQHVVAKDFFLKNNPIKSSSGHTEYRYGVRTWIVLGGRRFKEVITLADRSDMKTSLLLGRRLLRSRFLVNVELNESGNAEWKF